MKRAKRRYWILAALLSVIFSFLQPEHTALAVEQTGDINQDVADENCFVLKQTEIKIGNTYEVKLPDEIPKNVTINAVSSNEAIAYYIEGYILACGPGIAEITLNISNEKERWRVVVPIWVSTSSVYLKAYVNNRFLIDSVRSLESAGKITVSVGKTARIQAAVAKGTFHGVKYSVDNSKVASVERDGIYCNIKGLTPGIATVTAKVSFGDVTMTKTMKVVVEKADIPVQNPKNAEKLSTSATWSGDRVYFGRYEQDNNLANGSEPILWRVLEVSEDSVLLMSEYCLESRYFHSTYKNVIWRDSDLRKWLNSGFISRAFTEVERNIIIQNSVRTSANPLYGEPRYVTTKDYVYLLSVEEAANSKYGFYKKWNSKTKTRAAIQTSYALANNAYVNDNGAVCWWLRDTAISKAHAAYVFTNGKITYTYYTGRRNDGVRPVIRLSLSSLSFVETDDGFYYLVVD